MKKVKSVPVISKTRKKQIPSLHKMTDTVERRRKLEEALQNRDTRLIVVEITGGSVIAIAALLGNILLCLAILKVRALRKIQNYYIVALAMSDFLLTLLGVSFSLTAATLGRWPFDDTICQIQGTLAYFFTCFSLLNITLIALHRYVKMVRSVSLYQKIYSKKNVLLSIGVCGIFCGVFTIPFVLQKFCFHPGILICFPCKSEDAKEQALLFGSYAVVISMSFPVIIFCYYKVFRKVRAHFAQIADSTLHEDALKSFAEEVKITKILFAVMIAFLLCWSPVATIESLDTLGGGYILQRQVYLIATFAGAANLAINPVIYGLMQKQFRDAYKKVLKCTKN